MALSERVRGQPIPPSAVDRTAYGESVRATRQRAVHLMVTALGREEERIGGCGHRRLTLSTRPPVAGRVTAGLGWERPSQAGRAWVSWLCSQAVLLGSLHRQCFGSAPPSLFSLACGFPAEMYYFSKHPKW